MSLQGAITYECVVRNLKERLDLLMATDNGDYFDAGKIELLNELIELYEGQE